MHHDVISTGNWEQGKKSGPGNWYACKWADMNNAKRQERQLDCVQNRKSYIYGRQKRIDSVFFPSFLFLPFFIHARARARVCIGINLSPLLLFTTCSIKKFVSSFSTMMSAGPLITSREFKGVKWYNDTWCFDPLFQEHSLHRHLPLHALTIVTLLGKALPKVKTGYTYRYMYISILMYVYLTMVFTVINLDLVSFVHSRTDPSLKSNYLLCL